MNPTVIPQFYGDAGTLQTVTLMREMVEQSYLHPWIRERAAIVTQPCNRNPVCDHQLLNQFVREAIQYISDPLGTEVLADPITFVEARLRQGAPVFGDCAQMVTYLCSLLKSIGHAPKFKVIGDGQELTHVFVECEGEDMDPTLTGFDVPQYYERFMLVDA